jgi:subtilisin family serine protease
VAAAGNDGPACETVQDPLALYEEVFSVGAIDQGGNLASFSSRGPVTADGSGRTKPDIVAPGVDVLSSFPNNSYEYLPGTSMAGPHVAGVVALMWSANPSLIGDVERTEEILRHTAKPYDGSLPSCVSNPDIPNNGVGYGIVDAYAAVKMALEE